MKNQALSQNSCKWGKIHHHHHNTSPEKSDSKLHCKGSSDWLLRSLLTNGANENDIVCYCFIERVDYEEKQETD